MSQLQLVLNLFNEKPEISIKQASEETGIKEPNIRRLLGQGTIKGTFKRIYRGVYTLANPITSETQAYIQLGKAQDILPVMAQEGHKFDVVFLDIPYYSKALVGGNRGIKKYSFLHPDEFYVAMQAINKMLRTPDTHVYLMLSGAPTAQNDMNRYLQAAINSGLQVVKEGKYQKLFANGKPVTNVRGEIASAERLILLSQSGQVRQGEITDITVDFTVERPAIKSSYPTQKAPELSERIILQSTHPKEHTLDCCAGSGMFGVISNLLGRITTLIESLPETIEQYIIPNYNKYLAV